MSNSFNKLRETVKGEGSIDLQVTASKPGTHKHSDIQRNQIISIQERHDPQARLYTSVLSTKKI